MECSMITANHGAVAGPGPTRVSGNLVTYSRTRASPESLFWLELIMFHECYGIQNVSWQKTLKECSSWGFSSVESFLYHYVSSSPATNPLVSIKNMGVDNVYGLEHKSRK